MRGSSSPRGSAAVWSAAALAASLVAASVLGAACRPSARTVTPPAEPRVVASNVERRDYAGSAACAPCHSEIHAKWSASPMQRMTRSAKGGEIRAPFDGATFGFKGDKVTALQQDGRRFVRVELKDGSAQLFRVTKVIGGRYREDYVGVEVDGVGPDAKVVGDPTREPVLPVSYLLFSGKWRYKGYSVLQRERAHVAKHGAPWRQTCIFCHNTEPYLATVYDDLRGGGRTYQGSVSDGLMPPDRLWKIEASDAKGLGRAVADELAFLGASPAPAGASTEELLDQAITATHDRFGEAQLVETGVGCEACHNGARQHVEDPTRLPSFAPESSFLRVARPVPKADALADAGTRGPSRAELVNHVCARCHTVLFSRYPYTWEGRSRAKHPGGSTVNSGEARDFLLGACTGGLACTACHDPHGEDRREDLDRLGTVAGNDKCTGCHARYQAPADRAHHTHHAPEGAGSACLACHMPRKNAGLAYRLTRYHRIGSPTDADRVLKDRPLECALCHADRSVEDLTATMERWWHKRYDRRTLRELYGDDLGESPISAALRGKPHEQLLASAVLAERGQRADAARIAPVLSNEYPLVRYWAREAIERLTSAPLDGVDVDGEPEAIGAAVAPLVERWKKALPPR
jgi:hypothetical protein